MMSGVVCSSRRVLAVAVAGVLGLVLAVVLPVPAEAATTLGAGAARTGRFFGAAVQARFLGEAPYATVLNREFTSVTPEVELRWSTVEPQRNLFNFYSADQVAFHARSRGIRLRGHLVGPSWLPGWLTSLPNAANTRVAMINHINVMMTRYRGVFGTWDVVSEAFADTPGAPRRPTVFQQWLGDGYIEEAFRAARAADPAAKLCYNDYGIEDVDKPKGRAVLTLVRDLKARGVPIDCVGLESRFDPRSAPLPASYLRTLEEFAALGVDVEITQLDVAGGGTPQADTYRAVVVACLAVPRCTGITVWGIPDHYSSHPLDTPLLFDRNYAKKPAYDAVLIALG
ncbi:endo-1,4-beta-xylanase [Sphaerisporangium aureirubrum]|uniref:Beta-xylanase n=1 Tax=Sphaerisporangium aureirubrum TaxID=1544736 RepID=A0ABW1NLP3_9ACTN